MLHYFRTHAKSTFATLVLVLTLAGVLMWTFSSQQGRSDHGSYRIHHETITPGEYRLYHADASQSAAIQREFPRYVLAGQFARHLGFVPDYSAIQKELQQSFGAAYADEVQAGLQRYLRSQGATALDMQRVLARENIIHQWQNWMQPAMPVWGVTPMVLKHWHQPITVDVAWLYADAFDPTDRSSSLDEGWMRAYYQAHRDQWVVPTQRRIDYILIDPHQVRDVLPTSYQAWLQSLDEIATSQPSTLQPLIDQVRGYGFSVVQTSAFALDHPPQAWLKEAVVQAAIAQPDFDQGFNSHVLDLADGRAVVMRIADKKEATLRSFEQVRPEIEKAAAQRAKAMAMYQAVVERLYAQDQFAWSSWIAKHHSQWLRYDEVESYDSRLEQPILAVIQDWLMQASVAQIGEVRVAILDDRTLVLVRLQGANALSAKKKDQEALQHAIQGVAMEGLFRHFSGDWSGV